MSPLDVSLPRAGATLAAGPRVLLRTPTLRDRDEFLTMNRRSVRFYRGVGRAMTTPAAFAMYIRRCRTPQFLGMLICRRADSAIVGSVNVSEIVRGTFRSAYLGYQMLAPYAHQGYMTDAMPLVLQVVFRRLKLHRVEANIQPTNAASIALVKRAGFRLEGYSPRYLRVGGRWRDHERWALTAEDWRRGRHAKGKG